MAQLLTWKTRIVTASEVSEAGGATAKTVQTAKEFLNNPSHLFSPEELELFRTNIDTIKEKVKNHVHKKLSEKFWFFGKLYAGLFGWIHVQAATRGLKEVQNIAEKRKQLTALWDTIDKNNFSSFRKLLSPITAKSIINEFKHTLLHKAAESDNPAFLVALIEAGADPNSVTTYGQTPLYYAINAGKVHNVQALLKKGANPDTKVGEGMTLLHIAVFNKSKEIVQALLDYKVTVNVRTDSGESALEMAQRKDSEIAQLLMEAEAKQTLS